MFQADPVSSGLWEVTPLRGSNMVIGIISNGIYTPNEKNGEKYSFKGLEVSDQAGAVIGILERFDKASTAWVVMDAHKRGYVLLTVAPLRE
ncbi:hypothetical protein JFT37_08825 [Pseudomonas fluorescens]|nr:hypothetical protein [Pseudomonas fluorescens]